MKTLLTAISFLTLVYGLALLTAWQKTPAGYAYTRTATILYNGKSTSVRMSRSETLKFKVGDTVFISLDSHTVEHTSRRHARCVLTN